MSRLFQDPTTGQWMSEGPLINGQPSGSYSDVSNAYPPIRRSGPPGPISSPTYTGSNIGMLPPTSPYDPTSLQWQQFNQFYNRTGPTGNIGDSASQINSGIPGWNSATNQGYAPAPQVDVDPNWWGKVPRYTDQASPIQPGSLNRQYIDYQYSGLYPQSRLESGLDTSWIPTAPSWLNDPNNNPNKYVHGGQFPGWNTGWYAIANPDVPTNWQIEADPTIVAANKAITDRYGDPWSIHSPPDVGGMHSNLVWQTLNPGWSSEYTPGSLKYDEGTGYLYYDPSKGGGGQPTPTPSPPTGSSPPEWTNEGLRYIPSQAPTTQPTQQFNWSSMMPDWTAYLGQPTNIAGVGQSASPISSYEDVFGPFQGYSPSTRSRKSNFISPEASSFVNPFDI